jgi:hypothetical protein
MPAVHRPTSMACRWLESLPLETWKPAEVYCQSLLFANPADLDLACGRFGIRVNWADAGGCGTDFVNELTCKQ